MHSENISNAELISKTKSLAAEERKLTLLILWHLREIDYRRLYGEMGFGSLYEYCTQELKYTEGAAHRRISAMRLLREVPEVETAIQEGKLSLTTVSLAQDFLRTEKRDHGKKELLTSLQNQSKRECL